VAEEIPPNSGGKASRLNGIARSTLLLPILTPIFASRIGADDRGQYPARASPLQGARSSAARAEVWIPYDPKIQGKQQIAHGKPPIATGAPHQINALRPIFPNLANREFSRPNRETIRPIRDRLSPVFGQTGYHQGFLPKLNSQHAVTLRKLGANVSQLSLRRGFQSRNLAKVSRLELE
jgi:hypothetical protein